MTLAKVHSPGRVTDLSALVLEQSKKRVICFARHFSDEKVVRVSLMVVATNGTASENPNQKEKKIPFRQAFLPYRTNISFPLAYFILYII